MPQWLGYRILNHKVAILSPAIGMVFFGISSLKHNGTPDISGYKISNLRLIWLHVMYTSQGVEVCVVWIRLKSDDNVQSLEHGTGN